MSARFKNFWKIAVGAFLCFTATLSWAEIGFDSGQNAPTFVEELDASITARPGRWVRLRGLPDPGSISATELARNYAALRIIHQHGLHICVLIQSDPWKWSAGVRADPGSRLPLDLREAYWWMVRLASIYPGVIDAWEIDNEPDIGFSVEDAETYAAFLKACYLGVGHAYGKDARSAVLMAPLALPAGPYLERLVVNNFIGYTDGFNFHYYGYARDFTGVYNQFQDAVSPANSTEPTKQLSVFVTEFGYGLLDGVARNSVEGRVRQLNWFRDVSCQIEKLRIEGPMAFLLKPYFEREWNEFGLTARDGTLPNFKPSDLGAQDGERWLKLVGNRVFGNAATPALAWLLREDCQSSSVSKSWTVRASAPSQIVIDFVIGDRLSLIKNQLCLVLSASGHGSGELRVYNFSNVAVTGVLQVESDFLTLLNGATPPLEVHLQPGELKKIPVAISTSDQAFHRSPWKVRFQPDLPAIPPSVYETAIRTDTSALPTHVRTNFDFPGRTAFTNRNILLKRSLAPEEPGLVPQRRWLVTDGVKVSEANGTWRFRVTKFPPQPLRPAMAELPLPSNFCFPLGTAFRLEYDLAAAGLGAQSERFDVYFRTANGNLYLTWPPLWAGMKPQRYEQNEEDFTMGFFGRSESPWRFIDNQPVSLVFFFRPKSLPAEYEIRNAKILSWKN